METILDFEANRFWAVDRREVPLGGVEFRLLELLWRNRGRILTTDTILGEIWYDLGRNSDRHVLEVTINRLRTKLDIPIHTRKGVGYGIINGWLTDAASPNIGVFPHK